MDPNANLEEQRRIVARIVSGKPMAGDAERLADLVEALDGWISRGGFIPAAWNRETPYRNLDNDPRD